MQFFKRALSRRNVADVRTSLHKARTRMYCPVATIALASPLEFAGLLLLLVVWYAFVPLGRVGSSRPRAGDARFYAALATMPSPGVFAIAWFVLYGLITGSLFVYVRDAPPNTATYTATCIASLVNLLTNKAWSVVFFESRAPTAALGVLVLVDLSAAAMAVGMALDAQWLALGLLVPYLLWLLVATYLNLAFLRTLAAYTSAQNQTSPLLSSQSSSASSASSSSSSQPAVRYVPPQRR